VRRAERLSNHHWKLVYLRDHSDWRGEGIIVEKDERRATVLIPELALEAKIRLRGDRPLNDSVQLIPREIDLPELACYFRVRE
jgi:exoribonuclease-2